MTDNHDNERVADDADKPTFAAIGEAQGFTVSDWHVRDVTPADMDAPHRYPGATVMVWCPDFLADEPDERDRGASAPIQGEHWIDLWWTADFLMSRLTDDRYRIDGFRWDQAEKALYLKTSG